VVVSTTSKHRVLLADDDLRILRFARLKLMASGYDVVTAVTGKEALDMVDSEGPDILVLDLKMPGMGGLDVLKALRVSSGLPVIVISAATDLAGQALDAGADAFMSKPFNPDELPGTIRTILSGNIGTNGRPSSRVPSPAA
jgi:DNA-binding response OmpR family regulator